LIEAMSTGCPAIGSRIGGIPFVIRDGIDGLLVPPNHADALAEAIGTVLGDAELAAQLGTNARQAAADTWDWSHQRQRTLTELRLALATPGDRR
jgi:glycosyltransferase involved in cell wall biosynthesis